MLRKISTHTLAIAPRWEASQPCGLEPERLVGLGFRYWMHGTCGGDIASSAQAWQLYSGVFGVIGGTIALDALSAWAGVLQATSQRGIEVAPRACPAFCRDECMAISMIAACQHDTCPAMRACAFALVDHGMIDSVVARAHDFAGALASLDHVLSPQSIMPALGQECIRAQMRTQHAMH